MSRSPVSRVHPRPFLFPLARPRARLDRSPAELRASTLLLVAALAACGGDDGIKDQASGTIDKSPASWSEPGATADPPVVREPDAALLDASQEAGAACTDASLAAVTLTAGSGACDFTINGAPVDADEQLFTLELDEVLLTDGYQISGTSLTLTGAACATWQGADAGSDGGLHMLTIRYQACVSAE